MAANLHVRGIDPTLMARLKEQAMAQDLSINSLVLQLLQGSMGLAIPKRLRSYHDLDKLAGTWDAAQATAFKQACTDFEEIDKGLWE